MQRFAQNTEGYKNLKIPLNLYAEPHKLMVEIHLEITIFIHYNSFSIFLKINRLFFKEQLCLFLLTLSKFKSVKMKIKYLEANKYLQFKDFNWDIRILRHKVDNSEC